MNYDISELLSQNQAVVQRIVLAVDQNKKLCTWVSTVYFFKWIVSYLIIYSSTFAATKYDKIW